MKDNTLERRLNGIDHAPVAANDALPNALIRDSKSSDKVRVSIDVSPELFAKLQAMAHEMRGTKSDVLRKSLALMDVAMDARKRGKKIGIADSSDQLTTEIIGFEY